MSAKAKQEVQKAAKERRQKQIVIAGAVLLAIIVAIQVPRMMKSSSSSAPTTSTATASTTTEVAAPTPLASASTPSTPSTAALAAPIAAAAANKLPDSDVAPKRTTSQLVSFEMFGSKDPFAQQVSNQETAPTGAAAPAGTLPSITSPAQAPATVPTTPSAAPAPAAPASEVPASAPETAPTSPAPASSDGSSSAAAGASLSAAIEVNGARQSVGVGQSFPKANPTFKLVSLANGVAMIGIAGGSYASGAPTVSLQSGKALTLVNTTDGVHYQLQLLSVS